MTTAKFITLSRPATLHDMLVEMQDHLVRNPVGYVESFVIPSPSPNGPQHETFGVNYTEDDDGNDCADVGHTDLPTDVYALIEDGTYGELQGWRILL